jgi:hypothetical protein
MKPFFLDVSRRIQLKKKSGKNRKIPTLIIYMAETILFSYGWDYYSTILLFHKSPTVRPYGAAFLRPVVQNFTEILILNMLFFCSVEKKKNLCSRKLVKLYRLYSSLRVPWIFTRPMDFHASHGFLRVPWIFTRPIKFLRVPWIFRV